MIWPFRPHPPLSLTHKVQLERHFRSIAGVIGSFSSEPLPPICPQDIDPVLSEVSQDEWPSMLFRFFARRIPVTHAEGSKEPVVEWASFSLLDANGQPQTHQRHLDRDDRVSKIQIDPSLKQFPYRVASIAALGCAECWFRNLNEPQVAAVSNAPFDALPVFYGITPILANGTLYNHSESDAQIHISEESRIGSLSALEHGYLMALAEYSLGCDYTSAMSWMRPDASKTLKAGLKFLQKTHDSLVSETLSQSRPALTYRPTAEDLAGKNETVVLSGLLDLVESKHCPPELTDPVVRLLADREVEIRKTAAMALRGADHLSEEQISDVYGSLDDSAVPVRAQTIMALRPGFDRDDDVVDRLVDFLTRPECILVEASVRKLKEYSDFPDRLQSTLLKAIHTLIVKGASEDILPEAVSLLGRVHEQPEELLAETFADDPTVYSTLFANHQAADGRAHG